MRILLLTAILCSLKVVIFAQTKPHDTLINTVSRASDFTPGRLDFIAGRGDTFFIGNTRFRILYSKKISLEMQEPTLLLERYNKKWEIIDDFSSTGLNYEFRDVNKDGYDDLLADHRWQYLVYLFNPQERTFIRCGYFSEDYDTLRVISADKNIYFDNWRNKFDNWWSYLYTIKNYVRYNLGIIEYKYTVTYGKGDTSTVTKEYISVRKIFNDTSQKEISQIKNVDFKNFDIQEFWQREKNKFYPNALMAPNYSKSEMYSPIMR